MALDFFVETVTFNGTDTDTILSTKVEHTFSTDIKKGNAALQSVNFFYNDYHHYVQVARMSISNVQIQDNTISCTVEVELREAEAKFPITDSTASVLFIVDCD